MVPDPLRWMRRFKLTNLEDTLPSPKEDYNEKKSVFKHEAYYSINSSIILEDMFAKIRYHFRN